MSKLKSLSSLIAPILILFLLNSLSVSAKTTDSLFDQAAIYYSQYCSDCSLYLQNELLPILKKYQMEIVVKDFIVNQNARLELQRLNDRFQIPNQLQGHLMTIIDDSKDSSSPTLILGGHIPLSIITNLLNGAGKGSFKTLLVLQNEMHGEPAFYQVGQPQRPIIQYPISASINQYFTDKNNIPGSKVLGFWQDRENKNFRSLLPLVLTSGFLDGLNPCAFAVLLFFIGFLLALRKSLVNIFVLGLVYIIVIYLTYLGIGLGLFKAVLISNQPHLMAKVGSLLMITLGLLQLKEFFLPKTPKFLKIPTFSQPIIREWLTKATLPAIIVGAFLVGLCTFPCSGGIYVAIVTLLAAKTTQVSGLTLLLLYNLMFVLPLLIILTAVANRTILGKLAQLEKENSQRVKLILGIAMIALGVTIVFWLI